MDEFITFSLILIGLFLLLFVGLYTEHYFVFLILLIPLVVIGIYCITDEEFPCSFEEIKTYVVKYTKNKPDGKLNDPCDDNSDCLSGLVCSDLIDSHGVCKVDEGGTCYSGECGFGLECINNVCVKISENSESSEYLQDSESCEESDTKKESNYVSVNDGYSDSDYNSEYNSEYSDEYDQKESTQYSSEDDKPFYPHNTDSRRREKYRPPPPKQIRNDPPKNNKPFYPHNIDRKSDQGYNGKMPYISPDNYYDDTPDWQDNISVPYKSPHAYGGKDGTIVDKFEKLMQQSLAQQKMFQWTVNTLIDNVSQINGPGNNYLTYDTDSSNASQYSRSAPSEYSSGYNYNNSSSNCAPQYKHEENPYNDWGQNEFRYPKRSFYQKKMHP